MKKTYSELIEYYENVSPREIIADMYFDYKEELANKLGYDITNWQGVNKKLLLRNCVEPEVAEYIMKCLKDYLESQV